MAADERECVDLWSVLEDAEATVEGWPEWQREVEVCTTGFSLSEVTGTG
jgi:hypothetical protein